MVTTDSEERKDESSPIDGGTKLCVVSVRSETSLADKNAFVQENTKIVPSTSGSDPTLNKTCQLKITSTSLFSLNKEDTLVSIAKARGPFTEL